MNKKNFYLIIFFLMLSCKEKVNSQKSNSHNDNSTKIITEKKNNYVYKYEVDDNNLKNGFFKSYYLVDNEKKIASIASYKNDTLTGTLKHFIPDSILITEYKNISYNSNTKTFNAMAIVYDTIGNIKEQKKVSTKDVKDFTLIFDNLNCCFK